MSILAISKDPQPDEAEFNAFFPSKFRSRNSRAQKAILRVPITQNLIRALAVSS